MLPAVEAAFLCQTGRGEGSPHNWDYNRATKIYRCKNCLVHISKAELKELTDNA